ncbi:hypothetical protein MMC21_004293 [Puttea exsequens]|nr:hypothetical protein [Puttea exsequens]
MEQQFFGAAEQEMLSRLDEKRRQIDKEIARFKAAKEQEYRDFEEHLTRQSLVSGNGTYVEETSKTKHNRRRLRERKNATQEERPPDSEHIQHVNGLSQSAAHETNGSSGLSEGFHYAESDGHAFSSREGSPGPPTPSPERERTFEGVFTPDYLPLLNKPSWTSRSNSDELLEAPHSQVENILSLHRQDLSKPHLSSSAEYYHGSGMTSPPAPPARPYSSSVPQENQGIRHQRGASNGSLRRSSLRNPNSIEPKSPKKVLFSIDNVVVSPSTSPLARRKKENKRPSRKAASVGTGGEFEVIRSKPPKQPIANGAGLLSNSLSATPDGWSANTRISPLRWAMEGEKKASPPEDFEHVAQDEGDLFTFDEDLEMQEKKSDGEMTEGKYEGDVEGDGEDDRKGMAMGTSPHAGSLPIEIKWPGRREDRG